MKKSIQIREQKGFYKEELQIKDTKVYEKMLRMSLDTFQFILTEIDQDITSVELKSGSLKIISPVERLALTLRHLGTGK